MAKDVESPKKDGKKSLIAVGKEVIDSGDKSSDGLPPSISFSGVDPTDVVKAAQQEMITNAFGELKRNVMDSAVLQSQRLKAEEKQKLDALSSQSSPSRMSPQMVGGGGILNPMAGNDRAALLDSALKNLETDEAKVKFMSDHPELLSTSPLPFPGMVSHQSATATPAPSHTSSTSDLFSIIQGVGEMMANQMRSGMEIQRAITPQNTQSPVAPPIDVVNITNTFKEINEKNTQAFTELFKNIQEQNRASQDAANKALADSQAKIIELQMSAVERDKEYLLTRLRQLEDIARTPPQIPITQLREIISQANANGVGVTIDTPEQERIRAVNAREDRKLEHQFNREDKQLDIDMIREQRRAAALNTVGGLLGPLVESKLLNKHQLSAAGTSVSERF